jgi:hypothetical protein
VSADDLTQIRIAENQSRFRTANESIEAAAEDFGFKGAVPFICECPDRECTEIVSLDAPVYEEIRRHPRRFFNAPGHEALSLENGAGVLVEERDGYVLVDKVGAAGEVAAAKHGETAA